MEQPKYIYITLVFDKDDLNQHSMININGAERVYVENFPEFKQNKIETLNGNNIDKSKITRMIYCIVVDYGEEGIDVNEINKNSSSSNPITS